MVIKFPRHRPGGKEPVEYVVIMRDGNMLMAMVGKNLQEGIGGFGETIPAALRELAENMEKENWNSAIVR